MNAFGLVLLLVLIRSYYRRKWEGRHSGDPLDLAWICKRIDTAPIRQRGEIISCHFEKSNRALVFLVQEGNTLEWHFARHNMRTGWAID